MNPEKVREIESVLRRLSGNRKMRSMIATRELGMGYKDPRGHEFWCMVEYPDSRIEEMRGIVMRFLDSVIEEDVEWLRREGVGV